jgi:ankyrin repeat protein
MNCKTRDFGHTLLFVAVQSDDAELVKWLLTQGANPNAKLQTGDTPLKWVRSETVKKLLIDNGGK